WKLRRRLRSKARLFPKVFETSRLRGVSTLREFDDKITAHYCGFTGAVDYYARAAAANVVDRIAAPAFILHAANDPFIRILPETRKKILANPNITFLETEGPDRRSRHQFAGRLRYRELRGRSLQEMGHREQSHRPWRAHPACRQRPQLPNRSGLRSGTHFARRQSRRLWAGSCSST